VRLLRTRSLPYAVALGTAAYAVVFYEPTPAVTGLLFLVLTAYALWRGDVDWRTVGMTCGLVVVGFAVTFRLMRAFFRFDLLATMRAVAADAVEFNTRVGRPYGVWVGRNLIDLGFGAGLCQAVLAAVAVAVAIRPSSLRQGGATGAYAAFCVGLAATIVTTD